MSGSDRRPDRTSDDPDTLHAEFDWSTVSPSVAIVQTVAIAADQEAIELSPLIETLDPDALDQLFSHSSESDSAVSLSFQLGDYRVTVTGTGDVYVHTGPVHP
ncbi:HalOD1 output domain-containing protein [Haloarcula sp. CBA1127]|uniref:HalOD1 output domain-containing protein n=1 Tax=Haloarcula sp. CBA1127 TaxID=1765055 RepID=UPI00073E7207|nr:HalOD1 output domain-containing protein [Haloarcula sp. CBA1127]